MKKSFYAFLALIASCLAFFGCSNQLEDNGSVLLLSQLSNSKAVEYGSLTIGDDSRALDVSELTEATVTVYGSGMTPVSASGKVEIMSGRASATVERIPVGANRVVEVRSNVDGSVLYAVTDIKSGTNSTTVDWNTTALGAVYYNLIQKGTDVSSISANILEAAIPSVHGSLVDSKKIADDYPSLKASSNYRKATGTVYVTAADIAGYKVQITDPASEVKAVASASDTLSFDVAEGNYRIMVLDSSNAKVAEKAIVVGEGVETKVSAKKGGEITDKIVVYSAKSLGFLDMYVWSNGNASYEKVHVIMTENGDDYVAEVPVTSTSVILTKAANDWNGQTEDLSIEAAGAYRFNGSSFTKIGSSETGGVTLNVVNPAIVTKPTVTISPASGEVSLSGKITVTLTDGNGTISDASVKAGSKSYSYSDFTNNVLTINVSDVASAGNFTVTASAKNEKGTANARASLTAVEKAGVKIYVSATDGAPTIWAWTASIKNITNGAAYPGEQMANATGLKCNDNWYVITTKLEDSNSEEIKIILNGNSQDISTGKTSTFWYDAAGIGGTLEAKKFYDSDPSIKPDPVKPTLKISPASGKEIGTVSSIKIEANFGYDEITENSVTINGRSFTLSEGSNSYPVSDFATTEGVTISVSAALTNSKGTATVSATYTTKLLKEDPFTWDNVNAYFVLTDRFYNGDTRNDHSYFRQNKDTRSLLASGYNDVATFHGGDIKGLTEKLDYLDNLGVNAIWITAPYEQAHGWCTGGGKGFAHYAFHGYYTQDWTYMDQNMGTIEEFRTFVNEAHKRGIRIVMDVVMNHTGYNTVEDMITYDFGNFNTVPTHGWLGDGSWSDNHTITIYNEAGNWGNWWSGWIRAFGDQSWGTAAGFEKDGGGELRGSLAGLPDVLSEKTTSVAIPQFLKTKWKNESDSTVVPSTTGNTCGNKYGDYKLPSVGNADWYDKSGDWRSDDKGAPADYQVMWLSAWVREFGIDGFRCDTAKHIDMYRWGQLKTACQSALEAWRNDSSKVDSAGAKEWDENFWMTGEHFGWDSIAGQGDYYTTGGFDSMINFSIGGGNHWEQSGYAYHQPTITESTWGSYLNINKNADSDGNGNRNNVLTYLSSHDTRLARTADQASLGTMFTLLPGGIQIYYGDESYREKDYTECGDGDMPTRTDMNWADISGSKASMVAHWGKVGNFRKYNPAVGAGVGSGTKRTYSGAAGENKVAIGIDGTSVDVSGLFADGTTVYNWYDGTSAKVSGGKVTFAGGTTSTPILVSEKNPASCGVTF
ncbi:MAG: alpha-amylase family glycosyl hydrolase [Spirochaetia bacterium]|nr:alpha-amylase family glycosyl hydrolase [Spirochaetia bacterium]